MHPGAHLVAIADLDLERARGAADTYGADAYASHRDLIGKVDAVSIAAPASAHHAIARDLVGARIHVLIEKPIAADSVAARDLIAAAEQAGTILQVGHLERFSPAVAELRLRLNDPRRIAASRRAKWTGRSTDVDVILDLMIHDIDLVLTLAGAPVASVAANGASVQSDVTDEAEAWLTFTNGLIATLSASRVAVENERKLMVTEPDTAYVADLAVPSLTVTARRQPGAMPRSVPLVPRDNLGAEISAFLTSVRTGARPEVDGRAGLAALEIAERIQAAIAETETPARRASDR